MLPPRALPDARLDTPTGEVILARTLRGMTGTVHQPLSTGLEFPWNARCSDRAGRLIQTLTDPSIGKVAERLRQLPRLAKGGDTQEIDLTQ